MLLAALWGVFEFPSGSGRGICSQIDSALELQPNVPCLLDLQPRFELSP